MTINDGVLPGAARNDDRDADAIVAYVLDELAPLGAVDVPKDVLLRVATEITNFD